jgi:hypothetical protein
LDTKDGHARGVETRHLLTEDAEIDIGRGQHDIAETAVEIGLAGDGEFAQRLHGQPGAHGMGENVDTADARRRGDVEQQLLQRIARDGGALLVGAIGQKFGFRRPGEQRRHAAEAGVGHNLREAKAGFVEARVEAVDVQKDIAAGADAPGNMRRQFVAEFISGKAAALRQCEMLRRIGGAEARPLDLPRLMIGRHADRLQRHRGAAERSAEGAAVGLARRGDEHHHRALSALRLAGEKTAEGRAADALAIRGAAGKRQSEGETCGQGGAARHERRPGADGHTRRVPKYAGRAGEKGPMKRRTVDERLRTRGNSCACRP